MDGLLEGLAEQILPSLGIRYMLENGEYDIVPHQTLPRREEPEVPHDDEPLPVGEFVRVPQRDILLHGNFGRHPVIGAPVEIMLPRPLVLEGPKLVHVHSPAIEELLILGVHALREIVFRHVAPFGRFAH
jgi:hypothetical protein